VTSPRRPAQGFTLVELMIVVAIIGILSSVALPVFKDFTQRSRQAERRLVLRTIKQSCEDIYVRYGRVEDQAGGWLPVLVGQPNPPGAPTASKRPYSAAVPGWGILGVNEQFIDGTLYYTYQFTVVDVAPNQQLWQQAEGDLDLDGRLSLRWEWFSLNEQNFNLIGEYPPAASGGANAPDVDVAGVPTW
jgi:prepilin-type N-terminal cleavage/methylation domain-containing protein